jgi:hypothetical protein
MSINLPPRERCLSESAGNPPQFQYEGHLIVRCEEVNFERHNFHLNVCQVGRGSWHPAIDGVRAFARMHKAKPYATYFPHLAVNMLNS